MPASKAWDSVQDIECLMFMAGTIHTRLKLIKCQLFEGADSDVTYAELVQAIREIGLLLDRMSAAWNDAQREARDK